MAESSNTDSTQKAEKTSAPASAEEADTGSAKSQQAAPEGSETAQEPASEAASDGSAEASSDSAEEKPAKAAGTSGWKTPSKPASKTSEKTTDNTTDNTTDKDTATAPAAKTASQTTSAKATSKALEKSPAKTSAKTGATRTTTTKSEKPAKEKPQVDVATVRTWLATAIWVLAVIAALIMAAGALAVSLDFNEKNAIVKFVTDTAENLKLFGDFKNFKGSNHEVKDVLVNNGIYAILYLVVGKVLDRLIRP